MVAHKGKSCKKFEPTFLVGLAHSSLGTQFTWHTVVLTQETEIMICMETKVKKKMIMWKREVNCKILDK